MQPDAWNLIVADTYATGKITISKSDDLELQHPSDSGLFVRSIGEPRGQIADWRTLKMGIESGVHLVEFSDRYELHVDLFDPHYHPIMHLLTDVGPAKIAIGLAIAAALRKFGRSP